MASGQVLCPMCLCARKKWCGGSVGGRSQHVGISCCGCGEEEAVLGGSAAALQLKSTEGLAG